MTKRKSRKEQIVTTVSIVSSISGLDLGVYGACISVGKLKGP
jgi:hypothetical protein